MKKRMRFTLIELLMVISIIAILASLLLPALRNARMTSKQIKCAGNLKNVGLANLMYAGDYDCLIPPPFYNPSNYYKVYPQTLVKTGYVNDKSIPNKFEVTAHENSVRNTIFKCPEYSYGYYNIPVNYAMFTLTLLYFNGAIPAPASAWDGYYPSLKKIRKPTETFMYLDPTRNDNFGIVYISESADSNSDGFLDEADLASGAYGKKIHGKTYNALFFDGHVNALKRIDLNNIRPQ